MWKFDPLLVDIIWAESISLLEASGIINFGETLEDDLELDTGERSITGSIVDGGERVDGNI